MLLLTGLRRTVSAAQRILNSMEFVAPLFHTAIPERSSGETASYTGGALSILNSDGYQITTKVNEVPFPGARRVYNEWTTSSVSLASGANKSLTLTAGVYQFSMGAGTGTATFSGTGGATGTLAASASGRVSVAKTVTAGTFVVTASVADLADLQVCNITAETDQTTPREYVSVGVESAPAYHGSMVDGVKCFPTDLSGNPLPTAYTYDAVSLSGASGSYVSTPDSVANSITGDIDIRVKAALIDWTPSGYQDFVNKDANSGAAASRSYDFIMQTGSTGKLMCQWSVDGQTAIAPVSTVATGFTDGTMHWVRVTRSSSTGVTTFYTSDDGESWTQLGDPVAGTAGALYNNALNLNLGTGTQTGTASNATGKIYQAQIYNGIDGTIAVDFDAARYAGGTTLTGSTGEVYTLNGTATIHATNSPMTRYQPWEARTNSCLQSNAFTTTWTNVGTPAATQDAVGPNGQANYAWTLTDNAVGAYEGVQQAAIAWSAGLSGVASILIEKKASTPVYPVVQFKVNVASPLYSTIIVNEVAGTVAAIATGGSYVLPTSYGCLSYNQDYWLVWAAGTQAGATVNTSIEFYPAGSTDGTTLSVAGQGSTVFCDAQFEYGTGVTFPSPRIATTTIAVARAACVLTYTGGNTPNFKTPLATFSRAVGVSNVGVMAALSDGTANEVEYMSLQSATAMRFDGVDGGAAQWQTTASNAYTPGATSKAAQSTTTNAIKMAKDGTGQTEDTTATKPTVTALQVGHLNGANQLNGNVGVAATTRLLSQSELNAVTQ